MCLHKKEKDMAIKKVGGGQTHWLADHHLASYRLGQIGGAPPLPYKYPLSVKVDTHTIFWRYHLQSTLS
jgi:hypothetical protein